jgi:pimeloyl-ACP methyl ester carboxylesterase
VLDWDWPPLVEFRRGLARFCRLIVFDKRGTGVSDRQAGIATLEQRTDDIRAVMDAADSDQAVLFGLSEGGSMACLFAATYPQRTRALLLWEVQARWVQTDSYPWGATPEGRAWSASARSSSRRASTVCASSQSERSWSSRRINSSPRTSTPSIMGMSMTL